MGAGDGSTAVVVLRHGDAEVVVARLGAVRPDMALVDALCRLQLAARRLGCSIALREPSPELRALLDLVGLAEVIRPDRPDRPGRPAGLGLQAVGEAEGGEELGVQEVVPGGDAPP